MEKYGRFSCITTREQLLSATVENFKEMGAGYRDQYLYKVLRQIDERVLESWKALPAVQLRKNLCKLFGVGPKVADCILLFGFGKGDVFPVDTWIHQMYNRFYENMDNREKIRENLT